MPTFVMPQLKPATDALIAKMASIREKNEGHIGLGDIMNLFPGLSGIHQEEIRSRGDILFKDGVFTNTGVVKDFQFNIRGKAFRIKIPQMLRGRFNTSDNGFTLHFEQEHTISGCAHVIISWMCKELVKIEVTQEKIFIDLGWDIADILIQFE